MGPGSGSGQDCSDPKSQLFSFRPHLVGLARRNPEDRGGLFPRQPRVEAELHQPGRVGIVAFQSSQGLIQLDDLVGLLRREEPGLPKIFTTAISAPFPSSSHPCAVDQDASHCLGGRGEEMAATIPAGLPVVLAN